MLSDRMRLDFCPECRVALPKGSVACAHCGWAKAAGAALDSPPASTPASRARLGAAAAMALFWSGLGIAAVAELLHDTATTLPDSELRLLGAPAGGLAMLIGAVWYAACRRLGKPPGAHRAGRRNA